MCHATDLEEEPGPAARHIASTRLCLVVDDDVAVLADSQTAHILLKHLRRGDVPDEQLCVFYLVEDIEVNGLADVCPGTGKSDSNQRADRDVDGREGAA